MHSFVNTHTLQSHEFVKCPFVKEHTRRQLWWWSVSEWKWKRIYRDFYNKEFISALQSAGLWYIYKLCIMLELKYRYKTCVNINVKVTKMTQGISNLSTELNSHFLQIRELRIDFTEVLICVEVIIIRPVLMMHSYKTQIQEHATTDINSSCFTFRKEVGKNWFMSKAVDEWNKQSEICVPAANMHESFKWRLGRLMDGMEELIHDPLRSCHV